MCDWNHTLITMVAALSATYNVMLSNTVTCVQIWCSRWFLVSPHPSNSITIKDDRHCIHMWNREANDHMLRMHMIITAVQFGKFSSIKFYENPFSGSEVTHTHTHTHTVVLKDVLQWQHSQKMLSNEEQVFSKHIPGYFTYINRLLIQICGCKTDHTPCFQCCCTTIYDVVYKFCLYN
jgi:hypothetical protein